MSFWESVKSGAKSAASSTRKAATKSKLKIQIKLRKGDIKKAKKQWGTDVWEAMKRKDKQESAKLFQECQDKVAKFEADIVEKEDWILVIDPQYKRTMDTSKGTNDYDEVEEEDEDSYRASSPRSKPSPTPTSHYQSSNSVASSARPAHSAPSPAKKTVTTTTTTTTRKSPFGGVSRSTHKQTRTQTQPARPPCAKCGNGLTGSITEFQGQQFHTDCFGCHACGRKFTSKQVILVGGNPHCASCADSAQAQPATSRSVTSNNRPAPVFGSNPSRGGQTTSSSTSSTPRGQYTPTSSAKSTATTPRGGYSPSPRGGGGGNPSRGLGPAASGGGGGGGGLKIKTKTGGMLQWVKNSVEGFNGIQVRNFTKSWKDGMVFAALVCNWRPDTLNLNKVSPDNSMQTAEAAFAAAEKAGVCVLFDPEDLPHADKKCVITQVTVYQRQFGNKPRNPEGIKKWNQKFH